MSKKIDLTPPRQLAEAGRATPKPVTFTSIDNPEESIIFPRGVSHINYNISTVNPNTMTSTGFVVQSWGVGLGNIEISGKTGYFIWGRDFFQENKRRELKNFLQLSDKQLVQHQSAATSFVVDKSLENDVKVSEIFTPKIKTEDKDVESVSINQIQEAVLETLKGKSEEDVSHFREEVEDFSFLNNNEYPQDIDFAYVSKVGLFELWSQRFGTFAVKLQYRGEIYEGYFDRFDVTEDISTPNTVQYNIRFIAVSSRMGKTLLNSGRFDFVGEEVALQDFTSDIVHTLTKALKPSNASHNAVLGEQPRQKQAPNTLLDSNTLLVKIDPLSFSNLKVKPEVGSKFIVKLKANKKISPSGINIHVNLPSDNIKAARLSNVSFNTSTLSNGNKNPNDWNIDLNLNKSSVNPNIFGDVSSDEIKNGLLSGWDINIDTGKPYLFNYQQEIGQLEFEVIYPFTESLISIKGSLAGDNLSTATFGASVSLSSKEAPVSPKQFLTKKDIASVTFTNVNTEPTITYEIFITTGNYIADNLSSFLSNVQSNNNQLVSNTSVFPTSIEIINIDSSSEVNRVVESPGLFLVKKGKFEEGKTSFDADQQTYTGNIVLPIGFWNAVLNVQSSVDPIDDVDIGVTL